MGAPGRQQPSLPPSDGRLRVPECRLEGSGDSDWLGSLCPSHLSMCHTLPPGRCPLPTRPASSWPTWQPNQMCSLLGLCAAPAPDSWDGRRPVSGGQKLERSRKDTRVPRAG